MTGPGPPPNALSPRAGDLFLARLLAKRSFRWTVTWVLFLNAAGTLYYRVGLGRSLQVLPWYGAPLSLYFLALAIGSRDSRCRVAHGAFGVLVAAVFTRDLFAGWTRAMGLIEVAASLLTLAALSSLARDGRLLDQGAVLESDPSRPSGDETAHDARDHDQSEGAR